MPLILCFRPFSGSYARLSNLLKLPQHYYLENYQKYKKYLNLVTVRLCASKSLQLSFEQGGEGGVFEAHGIS